MKKLYQDDELPVYDPVIIQINQKSQKKKVRPVLKWTNSDFVTYISSLLSQYGVTLTPNFMQNGESVGKAYDLLASSLKDTMNNIILKEYVEWWVNAYKVKANTNTVHLSKMCDNAYISKFLTRYDFNHEKVTDDIPVDAETLYSVGGVQSVLLSKGIVCANSTMKKAKEKNIFVSLSNAIKKNSKKVVINIMKITIKNAPYASEDLVDFISIAKPALDFYGINEFNSIKYREFFK